MRKFLKAVVLTIAVLPFAASAATGSIAGSKHDLSSTGGSSIRATTQTQLCIFCHTPHHALKQALIWNHVAAAADTFSAGTTTAGTSLASTQLLGPTLACLACHDGSQAIGAVNNAGAGAVGPIAVQGGANLNGAFQLASTDYANLTGGNAGGAGTMDKNHPVSIPYKGLYNGITSGAGAAAGLNSVVNSSCTSASGLCTTSGVAANGLAINLYGNTTNAGIECGSCHAVHNNVVTTNTFFLRAPAAGSAICLACHNK